MKNNDEILRAADLAKIRIDKEFARQLASDLRKIKAEISSLPKEDNSGFQDSNPKENLRKDISRIPDQPERNIKISPNYKDGKIIIKRILKK